MRALVLVEEALLDEEVLQESIKKNMEFLHRTQARANERLDRIEPRSGSRRNQQNTHDAMTNPLNDTQTEMKHLRYKIPWSGEPSGHPQDVMKRLGITYQHATPQSMGDQWWFWNCENIPEEMPDNVEELNLDPMKCIGFGLSEEDAEKIRDYKTTQP